jgi:hypothetical protein
MRTLAEMTTAELKALRAAISAERCGYCDLGYPNDPCTCLDDMDRAEDIEVELTLRGAGGRADRTRGR